VDQKALEKAVGMAVEHNLEKARLEQDRKVRLKGWIWTLDLPNWLYYVDVNSFLFLQQVELREVMEAEMRTQLRRQAAAHTDHLRDVLKVQEQELQTEAEEVCLLIFDLFVCTRLVKVPFYDTSVTPFIILLIPVFPVFAPRKAHETKMVFILLPLLAPSQRVYGCSDELHSSASGHHCSHG